mmetsp:Transcript_12364/g.18536  ORF Transcript_12364/g.18536 Transcript_12364/m.18536 type:complete len:199 (-) Transcript_12364:8-604(-)
MEYVFKPKAYYKLMVHCISHPHHSSIGLLLGKITKDGSIDNTIVDVVPLFHLQPLAPLMESSLALVHSYLMEEVGDVQMVGVYYSSDDKNSSMASIIRQKSIKICEKLSQNAILVSQCCEQLDDPKSHTLMANVSNNSNDFKKEVKVEVDDSCLKVLNGMLAKIEAESALPQLYDMDDHFEDPAKDFMNQLFEKEMGY